MSAQRKRLKTNAVKEAKALKMQMLQNQDYLEQLDEAFGEFKEGKSKTFEEIEIARQRRSNQ